MEREVDRSHWKTGQRATRKDSDKLGTIAEIDRGE